MSKPTLKELLTKNNCYPCIFTICKHNANHRHRCDDCGKSMLEGEEQVLTSYFSETYGADIELVAYDVICRKCHPGRIPKGIHYREPANN